MRSCEITTTTKTTKRGRKKAKKMRGNEETVTIIEVWQNYALLYDVEDVNQSEKDERPATCTR